MKKLHHSLEDWAFPGAELWHLSDTDFVSPPTSIGRYAGLYSEVPALFYLGDTLGHNIADGRIITNLIHKAGIDWRWEFIYRAQALNGDTLPANCYVCHIGEHIISLYLIEGGVTTWPHNHTLIDDIILNTWTKVRLTFYGWVDADLTYSLRQIFDIWVAGAWKEQFREDSPECRWQESSVNRLGFGARYRAAFPYQLMDDTEIWEKA